MRENAARAPLSQPNRAPEAPPRDFKVGRGNLRREHHLFTGRRGAHGIKGPGGLQVFQMIDL